MANHVVTIFKSFADTGAPFHRSVDEALKRIKTGKSKDIVEALRSSGNEALKKQLPGVCFNGTFAHRSIAGLKKHSGLIILDFDKFTCSDDAQVFKDSIISDEYVFACWISPSGNGVKVLVKIPEEAENHKAYFQSLEKHFNSEHWDNSGSDVSRLCFESYDADLYHNPESTLWSTKEEPDIEDIGTYTPSIAITSENRIITNLITWWEKKYGFVKDYRNSNLFKLAAAFNDFGISQRECESVFSQFVRKDFTDKEVNSVIRSAYKNMASHGTKFFEDKQSREKIEKLIRAGKKEKDITTAFPDIKQSDIQNSIESIKEGISVTDFWHYDENGNVKLSPHKFKFWLQQNNFFKYYPTQTSTFTFIQKDQNLLEETTEKRIKDFTLDYLMNRSDIGYKPFDFMAKNGKYFSAEFLSFLDTADVKLKEDTVSSSYLYYNNCVVEVNENGYRTIDYIDIDGFVWKRQIIDRDFTTSDHHSSVFRKFIWLISGKNVEKYNSFKSVLGYLMHSYKTSANNKAIIFNDETISENPNGGSGKGLFWNALSHMKKVASIDGKTFEFTKSFPYQTVSTDTQVLVFDDVKKNFSFESLFSLITEGITLEYKGQDAIKLPVQKSPKILITTNYTVGGVGGSFERRKFEVEMSSYFSYKHTPLDEFGHLLFDEWDDAEWSRFDNYMINCCQYYLKNGLVKHEFNNLIIRKFIKETCFEFYEWCEDGENIRLDARLYKSDLFSKFKTDYPDYNNKLTQKRFSIWIEMYCKFKSYSYTMDKDQIGRFVLIDKPDSENNKLNDADEDHAILHK